MLKEGLKEGEVLRLRNQFGKNVLPKKERYTWFNILLEQFKSPLIYVLIFAAAVSLYFRENTDFVLIFIVIIVDVGMGFYQEFSAHKTLKALKQILKPMTAVRREGKRQKIEVSELVPGDIVLLSSGDRVPADGRLILGNLLINEAILTGEEEAISKNVDGEDQDLVYMGTTVLSGNGEVEVTKIGLETEMGKIGKSLSEIKEEKTPLLKRLEDFSKNLALLVLFVCLLIFLAGIIFQKQNIWEMLRIAVVLSVAAIPEGLPIAVTVILALGMRRILKKKGLVRRLLSIETLGSTSVICTDKTGTLTEGMMRVVKTQFSDIRLAQMALIFANNERDSLEVALLNYVRKKGNIDVKKALSKYPRIYEDPFESEKRHGLSINKVDGKEMAFIVGAPETVLSFSKKSVYAQEHINGNIDDWARRGLKILACAYKDEGDLKERKNFNFLGLVGIKDPIREGVKEAMNKAQDAGIKIKIVTGDYRQTAKRVAIELGLKVDLENIMEGTELEKISKYELTKKIDKITLFARITPSQKLKIIDSLEKNGEIVAMTGDGINDTPALKKSNIGVAVGDATDVAKETSDLVLLDNNFKTIVSSVEEGRLIFANIKKVVGYVLSNSFVEITLIFGAMIFGLGAPLTVAQILWIHLICDGPPDIMLGFEPMESNLMKKTPKEISKESILSRSMKFLILFVSLTIGIVCLIIFWYTNKLTGDLALARTVAFASVSSVSLIYIFAFKNLDRSILRTENFFQNKYLFAGVIYGFILILAAIYIPQINHLLGTVQLSIGYWLLVLAIGVLATIIIEIFKTFDHKI